MYIFKIELIKQKEVQQQLTEIQPKNEISNEQFNNSFSLTLIYHFLRHFVFNFK